MWSGRYIVGQGVTFMWSGGCIVGQGVTYMWNGGYIVERGLHCGAACHMWGKGLHTCGAGCPSAHDQPVPGLPIFTFSHLLCPLPKSTCQNSEYRYANRGHESTMPPAIQATDKAVDGVSRAGASSATLWPTGPAEGANPVQ